MINLKIKNMFVVLLSILLVGCTSSLYKVENLSGKINLDYKDMFLNQDNLIYLVSDYSENSNKWINNIYVHGSDGEKKEIREFKYNNINFLTKDSKIIASNYNDIDKTMDLIFYDLATYEYTTLVNVEYPFSIIATDDENIYIDTNNELYLNNINKNKIIYKIDKLGKSSKLWDYSGKSYQILDIYNDSILYADFSNLQSIKYYIFNISTQTRREILEKDKEGLKYIVNGFYKNSGYLTGTLHGNLEDTVKYNVFIYDILEEKIEIVSDGMLITYNNNVIISKDENNDSIYKTTKTE